MFVPGGDMKIFIWNVSKSSILSTIECHPEVILSVSWNYSGSRIVTSCKDKIFRVINPRTGQVVKVRELLMIQWKWIVCSREWDIKVPNLLVLFTYEMVEFFRQDFRECPKDNMPFGMRFVNNIDKAISSCYLSFNERIIWVMR